MWPAGSHRYISTPHITVSRLGSTRSFPGIKVEHHHVSLRRQHGGRSLSSCCVDGQVDRRQVRLSCAMNDDALGCPAHHLTTATAPAAEPDDKYVTSSSASSRLTKQVRPTSLSTDKLYAVHVT